MGKLWRAVQRQLSRGDNYFYHASPRLFWRKPRLVPKFARLYLAYSLTRRNILRILDIAVTTQCPYRCPHCYPEAYYRDGKAPLSLPEIISAVDQARDMGVIQFNFQGGEPTLDLDRLEEIVSRCDPWGSYLTLSTNGFRHTLEDLTRIHRMGIDKMAISLHSGRPDEHDAFVGFKGSHARIRDALTNARRVGIETTLSMVITRDNADSEGVQEVFDLAVELNTILDVFVAVPMGRWMGKMDHVLTEKQYRWLDEVNRAHPNIRRDVHPHIYRRGCPAAKEQLYLSVFGDVLTCPFLQFSLGNIREQRLKGMRDKALANPWFSTYPRQCLACEHEEFFRKFFVKTHDGRELPAPWDDVFGAP